MMKKAMKVTLVLGLCFLFLMFVPSTAAAEFLFDFGPEDSPVASGFTRVSVRDRYTAGRGYGWEGDIPLFSRNENFSRGRNFLNLGALISDHVSGGENHRYPDENFSFRVDLPRGEYVAVIILGKLTETHATLLNRPPFWFRTYTVQANGRTITAREKECWLSHVQEHLSAQEDSFLPNDILFDKYILPYFKPRFFSFTSQGSLTLTLSAVCPINALMIYPKREAERLKERIERWKEENRLFIEAQFTIEEFEETLSLDLKERYTPQGYILFTRAHEEIFPGSRPQEKEVNRPTANFISPGEKGVLPFQILPLQDLEGVRATLTDLVSEEGAMIPKKNLSLWLARYSLMRTITGVERIRPWFSFPFAPTDFPSLATQSFSLYVRVPEGTPAGNYHGEVKISSKNAPSAFLPLVVKVLPFELREPDMLLGMYNYHPRNTLFRFVRPASEKERSFLRKKSYNLVQEMFLEMEELGFNTISMGLPWWPLKITEEGAILHSGEAKFPGDHTWDFWTDTISLYQKILGNNPFSIFSMGWANFIHPRTVPGFITRDPDKWEAEGFCEEATERAEKLLAYFYRQVEKNDWPEVIFNMSDELTNLGLRGGKFGRELASIYRQMADRIGFRIMASMIGAPEHQMLPYLDIAVINPQFPVTEESLKMIEAAGADFWLFNTGVDRFNFGFYLARTRPRGRLQWAFGPGHSYFNQTPSLPSLGRRCFSLSLDSNLNLGRRFDLEQMREGIIDYRYFITLEAVIKENKGTNNPELAKAVERAERLLVKITDGIKVTDVEMDRYAAPIGLWSPEVCQRLRWMLASSIMEVQNARD